MISERDFDSLLFGAIASDRAQAIEGVDLRARVRNGISRHVHRQPRRSSAAIRFIGAAVAAICLFSAGNLAAAYYAPRYGQALADAPVLGSIAKVFVNGFGLTEANTVKVNEVATSNGHSIRLLAVSADADQTVLLFEIDGRGLTGKPKQFGLHQGDYGLDFAALTVTDQFGNTYRTVSGGGTYAQLEPLAGPAAAVGARLTIHIGAINKLWLIAQNQPTPSITGNWTLHATVVK